MSRWQWLDTGSGPGTMVQVSVYEPPLDHHAQDDQDEETAEEVTER